MSHHYSKVAIALHWTTVAALVFEIGLGWRMTSGVAAQPFDVLQLHQSIGISVLLLTLARIALRMASPMPSLPSGMAAWERLLARSTHAGFYALLLALPLSGWLLISSGAQSAAIHLFGWLPWPLFPGASGSAGAEAIGDWAHRSLVKATYVLAALHVLGAMKHHFLDRTGELDRMVPGTRRMFDWRLGVITAAVVLLAMAGSGYRGLLGSADQPTQARSIDPRRTRIFAGIVQPILDAKCHSCHGVAKAKGGLRLDSFAAVMKGGEGGVSVVPGKATESELIRRMLLPREHKDAMPPLGRAQPTLAEGELIRWWIDSGAAHETFIAAADKPMMVQKILELMGADSQSTWLVRKLPPAPAGVIDGIRKKGFRVSLVTAGNDMLDVGLGRMRSGEAPIDAAILATAAGQIVWLDLAHAKLAPGAAERIASLTHLNRLSLADSDVSDDDLRRLTARLTELESLNLHGTGVGDASVPALAKLRGPVVVYLSRSRFSEAGIRRLREQRPDLKVIWSETA